jgi:hypothetical protein
MNKKINLVFLINFILFLFFMVFFLGDKFMVKTHRTQTPFFLMEKGGSEKLSLLPRDTVLYFDRRFSSGVSRYWFYVNINAAGLMSVSEQGGEHESTIKPLLALKPDQTELNKLMGENVLTKEDLMGVFKSKYLSNSEIQEILEEFGKD